MRNTGNRIAVERSAFNSDKTPCPDHVTTSRKNMSVSPYPFQMSSAPGVYTHIDGREYLYFAGTAYFQLQNHPALKQAAAEAIWQFGLSAATSRAITGTTPPIDKLEAEAARYFDRPEAVYLPSGYLSNIAAMTAMYQLGRFQRVFIDERAHYSLLEAAHALPVPLHSFEHAQPNALQHLLQKYLRMGERPLIATDGIFPVYGRLAPLPEYAELAQRYHGQLWVDDAHGMGLLGTNGRGCAEYWALPADVLAFGGTFSKAFGAYGGIVPGDAALIQQIKTGTILTGSTAPMAAGAAAASVGMQLLGAESPLRPLLHRNTLHLKRGLAKLGFVVEENPVPIVAFSLPSTAQMKSIQQQLMQRGIYIQLTSYKGADATGVLRIVVSAQHSLEQVDCLCSSLAELL